MAGYYFFFFFFQAEDGIRDDLVTGVQTCALPISSGRIVGAVRQEPPPAWQGGAAEEPGAAGLRPAEPRAAGRLRSEERRVGKECRSRGTADNKKKKKENRRAERCTSEVI